jgi:hypothetical protein
MEDLFRGFGATAVKKNGHLFGTGRAFVSKVL